jgi:hypothetical protein
MMIKTLARVEDEAHLFSKGVPGSIGFNMGTWISTDDYQFVGEDYPLLDICGTTCCFAGHAVMEAGYTLDFSTTFVENTGKRIEALAREVLGLDPDEDGNDCGPVQTPFYLEDLDQVYEWIADRMGIDEQVLREKVRAERKYA